MSHAEQIEALKGLLERVKASEGYDRELDADLVATLEGGEIVWKTANYTMEQFPAIKRPSKMHLSGFSNEPVLHVTMSVDAAIGLTTRALPGAMWATGCMEGGPFCRLVYPTGVDNGWGHTVSMEAEGGPSTEPLAILSALLSAKLALLTREESR